MLLTSLVSSLLRPLSISLPVSKRGKLGIKAYQALYR